MEEKPIPAVPAKQEQKPKEVLIVVDKKEEDPKVVDNFLEQNDDGDIPDILCDEKHTLLAMYVQDREALEKV